MPHRPIVILVALFFAVGVPMIYFVVKARAAASLNRLLAERFSPRPCPVVDVVVPSGGSVHFHVAYDDVRGSGFVLVLGNWARGRVLVGAAVVNVQNRVAGLFKAGDPAWLERLRNDPDLLVAAPVESGAIAVWKGLPSRRSVLAHLEAVASPNARTPRVHGVMLTSLDDFLIPLTCADVGIPIAGLELMSHLQAPDPVGSRIAAQSETFKRGLPYAAQQIVEVARLLAKYGLEVASPDKNAVVTFEDYVRWYADVTEAVADTTAPALPEHALALFGQHLGELMQAMALHIAILRLGGTLEALRYAEERSKERTINCARELETAGQSAALPANVQPHAAQLALMARSVILATEVPALGGPAEQAAGLEHIHKDFFARTKALRAALGG